MGGCFRLVQVLLLAVIAGALVFIAYHVHDFTYMPMDDETLREFFEQIEELPLP